MRIRRSAAVVVVVILGACSDTSSPDPGLEDSGIGFGIPDDAAHAHTADGQPAGSGSLLAGEFAVAVPDSLGGLVFISYDEEHAGLFILQLVESGTGTRSCAGVESGPVCHGRYFSNVRVTDGMLEVEGHFEISTGSVQIDALDAERIRGSFTATLEPVAGTRRAPSTWRMASSTSATSTRRSTIGGCGA